MKLTNPALVASAITLMTGILWGIYWVPVRELSESGLSGAWGTLAITAVTTALLLPIVLARGSRLPKADKLALSGVALGGAAFALYSISFLYGRVGMIVLLWFFSPVWSVLIARFVMGWEAPPLRLAAVGVGLAGLAIMLGASGEAPVPKGLGEWASLLGGFLWSVSTTIISVRPRLAPVEAAFVFSLGATVTGLAAVPVLEPMTAIAVRWLPHILMITGATALIWWSGSVMALLWAAQRIDPARVSILLMSEVVVGAVTSSVFAGESLRPIEIIGGSLVLVSGMLEVARPQKGK